MIRRPLSEVRYLVIHHSATPESWTVQDLRRLHKGMGYEDIGYHFVVREDGLHVGRPVLFRGAHAVTEKEPYVDVVSMNRVGIGLCIVGDFSSAAPAGKLLNEVLYAIRRVAGKYGIPLDRKHVIGHRDVSYTACPGPGTMKAIYQGLGI